MDSGFGYRVAGLDAGRVVVLVIVVFGIGMGAGLAFGRFLFLP